MQRGTEGATTFPNAQASEPRSAISALGATVGSLFTIGWVALVSFSFTTMLGGAQNDIELFKAMLWPFVVLGLGVPLIVFVWFGGVGIVSELARLRGQLSKLDQYIEGFRRMEETSVKIRDNLASSTTDIDTSASQITDASNALNAHAEQIKREAAQLVATLEKRTQLTTSSSASAGDAASKQDGIKERFSDILRAADEIFYARLAERNDSPGRGNRRLVVAPGGTNKSQLTGALLERLDEVEQKFLSKTYRLDMRSRMTGRSNITEDQLAELESLRDTLFPQNNLDERDDP
ncbi:hypothetical protein [Hyphomonas sp.]|uniref:hypothetical protein n=1 Tax=Hyphomonas sp. TaxID=87 RepID=UPI00391A9B10